MDPIDLVTYSLFTFKLTYSDIIFQQHMRGCYNTTAVLCTMQVLVIVASVILRLVFKTSILSDISGVINITLMIAVLANITIHNRAWRKAKEELEDAFAELDCFMDFLNCLEPNVEEDEETEEEEE